MTYEPRWDIDNAVGGRGEEAVRDICDALKHHRAEVKADAVGFKTGRLFFETDCRRDGAYVPSGVYTTEADVWVSMLSEDFGIVISTPLLRKIVWDLEPEFRKPCPNGSHPTYGAAIPIMRLVQAAYRHTKRRLR
jgi:hypothetical protein